MIRDILTVFLLISGAFFCLTACWGILKLPDLFLRMQASTKAATLGLGCLMLANAIHFDDPGGSIKAILFIAFLFITQPIAAHMIARAAYLTKVPLYSGTVIDQLKGHYDPESHDIDPDQQFGG